MGCADRLGMGSRRNRPSIRCRKALRSATSYLASANGLLSLVVSLMLLSSCRRSTPTPAPLLDLDSANPAEWLERSGLPSASALGAALSPDGQWLVDDVLDEASAIRVLSTSDSATVLEAPLDRTLGKHLFLSSWAPDSSTLLFLGIDDEAAHQPFDRIILFRLDTTRHTLAYDAFEPPDGALASSPAASWSPDSTRVAITVGRRQILVLDKRAAVKGRIQLQLDDTAQVSDLWWTPLGLLCRIDLGPADAVKHELIRVDPSHSSRQDVLYSSQSALAVLGADSRNQHLLIWERDIRYPLPDTFRLLALDMRTGAIDQTLETPGTQCVSADAPDSSVTALKASMADGTCQLWLYDWKNNQLTDYGPVVALVGWRSNVRGFLVVTGTSPDDLHFEAVRP